MPTGILLLPCSSLSFSLLLSSTPIGRCRACLARPRNRSTWLCRGCRVYGKGKALEGAATRRGTVTPGGACVDLQGAYFTVALPARAQAHVASLFLSSAASHGSTSSSPPLCLGMGAPLLPSRRRGRAKPPYDRQPQGSTRAPPGVTIHLPIAALSRALPQPQDPASSTQPHGYVPRACEVGMASANRSGGKQDGK